MATAGGGGGSGIKDITAKEKAERLAAARSRLKTYRARQPDASTSEQRDGTTITKRASLIVTSPTDASGSGHRPRKSMSKGNGGTAHGRKSSKSRNSHGGSIGGGHLHTRSRASTSFLNGLPSPGLLPSQITIPTSASSKYTNDRVHEEDLPIPFMDFSSGSARQHDFNSMAGWQIGGLSSGSTTPVTADARKSRRTSLLYGSASNFFNSEMQSLSSTHHLPSPSPPSSAIPIAIAAATPLTSPLSATTIGPSISSHSRRPSRHNRQSSVSNFRESIEIMSGTGTFLGGLSPGVSSFASMGGPTSPSSSPRTTSPTTHWSNDPVKMLEILKERGRLESAMENDPIRTRAGALEALEGRLAAPSQMIDLGNLESGQLLVAPRSPGYTSTTPSPLGSPSTLSSFSQPVGLGLSSKRNSWGSALGPVTAVGAKGALDLGMLLEEEEEEDADDDEDILPSPSKTKRTTPSKRRPLSLTIAPLTTKPGQSIAIEDTPIQPSFAARSMRLSSSSLVSTPVDSPSPSIAASPQRPQNLRSLTLSSMGSPVFSPKAERPGHSSEFSSSSTAGESRRTSQHIPSTSSISALASSSNETTLSPRTSMNFSSNATPPSTNRGMRSLATGNQGSYFPSPTTPVSNIASPMNRSPILNRRSSINSATTNTLNSISPRYSNPPSKRSSISYLTNTTPSLASPDGPLSPTAQASRRPWRTSLTGSSTTPSPPAAPIPSGTIAGYAFPFTSNDDHFSGFGELEVEEEKPSLAPPALSRRPSLSPSEDPVVLSQYIVTLRSQLDVAKAAAVSQATIHALETTEFEKKTGEEARGMRLRIIELERQLEEGRVGRRFEVEGLSREVEQAREAMADLIDERNSLREDVDGWKSRCAKLAATVKKEREDESLALAQAKLSGEMRDQIFNLVAALERERASHDETRQALERSIVERGASPPIEDGEEPALGSRGDTTLGHAFKSTSRSSSILSASSSFGQSRSGSTTEETSNTDFDESPSSKTYPPLTFASSAHSSSGGSKGRDSDFVAALTLGGLQTLPEEEEDDESTSKITDIVGDIMAEPSQDSSVYVDEAEGMALLEDEDLVESERIRLGSGSTDSTDNSEVMPLTPVRETTSAHNRSDSFVRHWSFPKGSVAPARFSVADEEHSFFDLGRHNSLPALPIATSILPPFLSSDLTIDDDDQFGLSAFSNDSRFFPTSETPTQTQHARRPSSPRPVDRMYPHAKRPSSQFKPPPVSPSALAHVALSSSVSSIGSISASLGRASPTTSTFASLSRLSLNNLSNLLNYVSPGSSYSPVSSSKSPPPRSTYAEDNATTPTKADFSRNPPKPTYVHIGSVRPPRASPLSRLDFRLTCCEDEETYNV